MLERASNMCRGYWDNTFSLSSDPKSKWQCVCVTFTDMSGNEYPCRVVSRRVASACAYVAQRWAFTLRFMDRKINKVLRERERCWSVWSYDKCHKHRQRQWYFKAQIHLSLFWTIRHICSCAKRPDFIHWTDMILSLFHCTLFIMCDTILPMYNITIK